MGKMKSTVPRPAKPQPVSRKKSSVHIGLSTAQQARLEAFRRYVATAIKDQSGEQQETWDILKKALDDNRTAKRKHFLD